MARDYLERRQPLIRVQRETWKIGGLKIRTSSHPARTSSVLPNGSSPEQTGENEAVRRAFGRASSWRTPPHWSRCDWLNEVRAIIDSAAAGAALDYDEERGVPVRAFIYVRAVAAAWTRYRQEWSYYLHCGVKSGNAIEPIVIRFDPRKHDETIEYFLRRALCRLSVEDQRLIHRLFWDDADQRTIAGMLQISQQCVSRRKARILRQLRRLLNGQSSLFSHVLTACGTLFDGLDPLPLVNLL